MKLAQKLICEVKDLSPEQNKRLASDWSKIAGEPVTIESVSGQFYGYCSELGALRLFHKYRETKNIRAEFSKNLGTWFFTLG